MIPPSSFISKLLISLIFQFPNIIRSRARLGSHSFDKDNKLAMEFVSAASNLRSRVFNIPLQSLYDAKGVPEISSQL